MDCFIAYLPMGSGDFFLRFSTNILCRNLGKLMRGSERKPSAGLNTRNTLDFGEAQHAAELAMRPKFLQR